MENENSTHQPKAPWKVWVTEWVKDRQSISAGRQVGNLRNSETLRKINIFKCVIEHTRPIGHYKKFKSAGHGQRRSKCHAKGKENILYFPIY